MISMIRGREGIKKAPNPALDSPRCSEQPHTIGTERVPYRK